MNWKLKYSADPFRKTGESPLPENIHTMILMKTEKDRVHSPCFSNLFLSKWV